MNWGSIVVSSCCFFFASPSFAPTQSAWPCADEFAKKGPYRHLLKVGTPISNGGLIEGKVAPDISDFKGKKLDSRIVVDVILNQDGKVVWARANGDDYTQLARTVDAAKQWTFRTYLLNDKPIPVQRQIVFLFEKEAVVSESL